MKKLNYIFLSALLLLTTFPLSAEDKDDKQAKAGDQMIKPFARWTGIYLVRNINNVIHCYAIKDAKMNNDLEKEFRNGFSKWAIERNKSWIYGIKLGADFSFEESRTMVITEQEADEMKKMFVVFSKIIE